MKNQSELIQGHNIIVVIIQNGNGDLSSNLGQDFEFHFHANTLEKGKNPSVILQLLVNNKADRVL